MSVTTDIVRTYRGPRGVLKRRLGDGEREDRALAILYAACGLIFVSRLPAIRRQAYFDDSVPFDVLFGATLMSMIFIWPLLAYGLAALSHVIARLFGGKGSWYGARMALFWALLAASPLWMLYGLTEGFIGKGPAHDAVGVVALGAFLVFWMSGLWEVETGRKHAE